MKKLLGTTIAASLLFTGLTAGHEAEAAKSNINYLSSSTVAKAKAGTLSMDGWKIGGKALTYTKSEKYINKSARVFETRSQYDRAYVDFQKSTLSSKRVVNRIVDKDISNYRTIERGDILLKYGNPLKSEVYKNTDNHYNSRIVDMYKNITFFYTFDSESKDAPVLDGVVIMHNKTKTAQRKWFDYATGEANYSVDEMNDFISSEEWAQL